ncbi:hypothetical protein CesoFtcFv8_017247 [Champsocephalus esox]|uniref:Uncharacterized protein n=1 Tax=Champsocephalus esox TaxID=159716 RepID=A0AAN8GNX3_9TELE|nr:hypothetical protein CesoFtcFv8_017247 [Champsocephalus esox]
MEAKQPSPCSLQSRWVERRSNRTQTTDWGHLRGWSQGYSMGQEGTCLRLAAAALPHGLTHPRVSLLLSLCPSGM